MFFGIIFFLQFFVIFPNKKMRTNNVHAETFNWKLLEKYIDVMNDISTPRCVILSRVTNKKNLSLAKPKNPKCLGAKKKKSFPPSMNCSRGNTVYFYRLIYYDRWQIMLSVIKCETLTVTFHAVLFSLRYGKSN